jgi:probable F420-dependent oxidoreductase
MTLTDIVRSSGRPEEDLVNTIVDAAHQSLGPVGALLPVTFTDTPSVDEQREAARRLERAGYGTTWTNEVIGKDALVQLAMLLGATERMVFGTSIANVWARAPQTLHAAAAQLADGHPGRLVLGLGVGYPQQAESTGREFGKPLSTMRDYVQRMDGQTWPPAPAASYPRLIAANGPKMLALAAEIADGALPAGLPPEYTALARQALGADKLLVVGMSIVVDSDLDRARAKARETVTASLGQPSYGATLDRLGYADELDGVGDRLVDAVVGHGDPAGVAAAIRRHLAAGADHVMVMGPSGDFDAGLRQLESLAPVLTTIG